MYVIALFLLLMATSSNAQEVVATSKPMRINLAAKDANAPDVFLVYKNSGAINAKGKVDVEEEKEIPYSEIKKALVTIKF